jgi:hypothetical protein
VRSGFPASDNGSFTATVCNTSLCFHASSLNLLPRPSPMCTWRVLLVVNRDNPNHCVHGSSDEIADARDDLRQAMGAKRVRSRSSHCGLAKSIELKTYVVQLMPSVDLRTRSRSMLLTKIYAHMA